MKLTNKQFYIIVGLGVVGLWYAKKKAADAVSAIDPTNNKNIFYGGVNKIGGALSDNPDFSLGSWVYDVFNKDESL